MKVSVIYLMMMFSLLAETPITEEQRIQQQLSDPKLTLEQAKEIALAEAKEVDSISAMLAKAIPSANYSDPITYTDLKVIVITKSDQSVTYGWKMTLINHTSDTYKAVTTNLSFRNAEGIEVDNASMNDIPLKPYEQKVITSTHAIELSKYNLVANTAVNIQIPAPVSTTGG